MKNANVFTIATLIAAVGVLNAAAQGAGPYYDNVRAYDYPLHAAFTGTNTFLIPYVAGMPDFSTTDLRTLSGAVATDGGGRVDGLVYTRIYSGGPNNRTNQYAAFTITVTGKINGNNGNYLFWDAGVHTNDSIPPGRKKPIKPGKGLVKLTLKGHGYDFDGISNHPNATLSLKFTSTNFLIHYPQFPPAVVTNSAYSITYADGSTTNFTDGPKTNINPGYGSLSGLIKGKIKPGKNSPWNNGNELKIDEAGWLFTGSNIWIVVRNTNFVQLTSAGGLIVDCLTNIDAQVLQPVPGSKLFLNANVGSQKQLCNGTGQTTKSAGTWSASLQGVAYARGSRLSVKGSLEPLIVAYDPTTDTNTFPSGYIPRIVQNAIHDVQITGGKIYGVPLPKMYGTNLPAPPPP